MNKTLLAPTIRSPNLTPSDSKSPEGMYDVAVSRKEKFITPRDSVQNTPQSLALTVVVADNRRFDS